MPLFADVEDKTHWFSVVHTLNGSNMVELLKATVNSFIFNTLPMNVSIFYPFCFALQIYSTTLALARILQAKSARFYLYFAPYINNPCEIH